MNFRKYLVVWLKTGVLSLESALASKGASLMFILGKVIRFFLFLWLLITIGSKIDFFGGYSRDQLVTFFLIFNFFDTTGQLFFRGIYWFRRDVTHGELDLKLIKPMNVLFQALVNRLDVLDIPMFLLILGFLGKKSLLLLLANWMWFLPLLIFSAVLILSIHILIAALCILTAEVDHTIMIFRDLSSMARIPVDVYITPIRFFVTFIVPVGIIMTFPAKALMGLLSWQSSLISGLVTFTFFFISLKIWHLALSCYSSASS